jgi:amino acid transporter
LAEPQVFVRRASGLVRNLNAWDVLWYNLLWMAPMAVTVYGIWAEQLFPGTDLPLTALLSIPMSLIVGIFYAMFSAAMPRSGGDYVWVSRLLHPVLGFMGIFFVWVGILGIAGSYVPWFTQWAISPILLFTGNSAAAALISNVNFNFVLAIIIYILFALLMSRGSKITMLFLSALGVIILVAWVVFVGTMLTTPLAVFRANFNAYSGMNYDQVIAHAQSLGIPLTPVASATALGVVLTYFNFIGFNSSVYMAGEIKNVQRNQLLGIVVAILIFGLVDWLVYYAANVGMGSSFIIAMANLQGRGDPMYTLSFAPYLHFLFQYTTRNPYVFGLVCFGWGMMTIGAILTYVFFSVRFIFAASFDRVLPSVLSKVDPNYNTPTTALIATTIIAIVMQVLWSYTPLLNYFVYDILGTMILQAFAAIAGIIFVYRRKDMFETSPSLTRMKIGSVPVMVILGVATLLLSIWLGWASVAPAYVGSINPAYLGLELAIYIIGAAVYVTSWAYHKNKGIPLSLVFKQLPPE